MRAIVIFGATLLTACADLREPRIDGAVDRVSAADVQAIIAATGRYFAARHLAPRSIYRIHIVDKDKVHIYVGEHYGSRPPAGIDIYLEMLRVKGKWQATEGVLKASGVVSGLTNRSSQPLAVPTSSFHVTSTLNSVAELAAASGG